METLEENIKVPLCYMFFIQLAHDVKTTLLIRRQNAKITL